MQTDILSNNIIDVDLSILGDCCIEQRVGCITNTIVLVMNEVIRCSEKQGLITIVLGDDLCCYIEEIKQNLSFVKPHYIIIIDDPINGNVTIKLNKTQKSINFTNI